MSNPQEEHNINARLPRDDETPFPVQYSTRNVDLTELNPVIQLIIRILLQTPTPNIRFGLIKKLDDDRSGAFVHCDFVRDGVKKTVEVLLDTVGDEMTPKTLISMGPPSLFERFYEVNCPVSHEGLDEIPIILRLNDRVLIGDLGPRSESNSRKYLQFLLAGTSGRQHAETVARILIDVLYAHGVRA